MEITNSEKKRIDSNSDKRHISKIKKTVFWILGIWGVLLAALQIALSSAVLERIARNFTEEYINGEVSFGKVSASVLRNFPNLNISFDSVSVTYPSDRFAEFENKELFIPGRSESCDTLMSFSRFSASVNILSLAAGQIRIPSLVLAKPRIFARNYNTRKANWNIFKASSSEESDSTSAGMPNIILGKIQFSEKPLIIFNSLCDTTSIVLKMKDMQFNGRLNLQKMDTKRVEFKLDSMFLAGRFPSDTIALNLDMFRIGATHRNIKAEAKATTYIATKSYGRIKVPVSFKSGLSFPDDTIPAVRLEKLKAEIADIPLTADAEVKFEGKNGIYIKGNADIYQCKINDVLKNLEGDIWKDITDIQTNAAINIKAECEGLYSPSDGKFPELTASINIPEANISHKKYGTKNNVILKARLKGNKKGKLDLNLSDFGVSGKAMSIGIRGSAEDLTGKDPLINIDATASVSLDTLDLIIKQNSGISTAGGLRAKLKGKVYVSQIDPYKFSEAQIGGYIKGDRLVLNSEKDSLDLYADSLSLWLGAIDDDRDSSITSGEHLLALVSSADSISFRYKNEIFARGSKLSATATNSASVLNPTDSSAFYPFEGKMSIGFLSLVGSDTTAVFIAESDNSFSISPKKDNPDIPVLDLKSKSKGIFLRGPVNRIGISNLKLNTIAAMNSIERKHKVKKFIDSLARQYPDVPADSLFAHISRKRLSNEVPGWLKESDFKKNDLHIDIDSSFKKVFMEWDADGKINFKEAIVITPFFPLKNTIHNFSGSFNNNKISLENLTLVSGTSNLTTSGTMEGLRGMVTGGGILDLDLKVTSDSLNINELLGAYTTGSKFNPTILAATRMDMTEVDDSDYQEMIVTDTLANATDVESSLIVVPANINMEVSLSASNVKYSNLNISELKSDLVAKERCVQFTNTLARSEIGNIDFEGFYATRTKKDLKTGFDLHMSDITAEKVIELMPAVDSVIPMLKSFKGNLNCDLAATASIDTNMNIMMPTIKGVIRISGNDLQMEESEGFRSIAKKLMFKDKTSGHIEKMSVEGVLKDNTIEIFPFVLKIDRYKLAMSGMQNLDMSFRYHISVLDSPIPFRLGIDLYGNNFDDFKFKIGKAKYKNSNVPVFSSVVDETRLNLKESINKIFNIGVDKALKENARMGAITTFKKRISYNQAVNQELDSLSANELDYMEKDSVNVSRATVTDTFRRKTSFDKAEKDSTGTQE